MRSYLQKLYMKIFKNNIKLFLGMLFGILLTGTSVYAATILFASDEVGYDNTSSGMSATNVQDALDELYSKTPHEVDFATASWDEIVSAYKAGKTTNLQQAMVNGITRDVDLGDFGIHQVRIANLSTPEECLGQNFSQTACGFVLEFADIIKTRTIDSNNSMIWADMSMRNYINDAIYNSLPTDLKNVIIVTAVVSGGRSTDKVTSVDKLYLLSPKEISKRSAINQYDSAKNLSRQLDYYNRNGTNENNSDYVKKYNNVDSEWWLRTISSNNGNFMYISTIGEIRYVPSSATFGVSPAFRIG